MALCDSLRIGIVVGEASGDILGAGLINSIQQRFPTATFEGIGGPRMLALGFNSFFPQERLAVMGYIEPLKRLPELLSIRNKLTQHFLAEPPDIFIGIDSPDFNLSLEQKLKAANIPTVHYVSPSVWAWKQKRIFKIAKAVDLMLTLFPFEAEFYRQHQVPVTFVGHPLADEIPLKPGPLLARKKLAVENKVEIDGTAKLIALMPGSRGGEVNLLGPVFLQTARWCKKKNPDLQFIIPAANAQRRQQIEQQLKDVVGLSVHLINGQSHRVMEAADVVLMASGTTTLEAMLLKRPMVVSYKMGFVSYAIISRMVKSTYISLPNLLADRELVPEILQERATPENLGRAVMNYIDNDNLTVALQKDFFDIHQTLRCDASEKAADAVLGLVKE